MIISSVLFKLLSFNINKPERTFKEKYVRICLVWCTIGDSNPGPTD